jgi:hypothetical protein
LQKSIAAFELFMLVLYDFHAIDNLHESSLKNLGLSKVLVRCTFVRLKCTGIVAGNSA